jgi:hypothetical protein
MSNKEVIIKKSSKEYIQNPNSQDINKRTELEKELNIQRNQKNKNKGPQLSDMKMNQLNYYNEIAKHNIHNLMNNPTLKDIVRITSNESIFDILKAKEQSKDLSKFLDAFPIKRVERINYKNLEIGQMRKDLGIIRNPKYNKEKCKKFAGNLFEKRKKEGSVNHMPILTIDNLNVYNQKYKKKINQQKLRSMANNKNKLAASNDETWFRKYKHNTFNANKLLKNKNENTMENNRYDNETYDVKSNISKDINNLASARIQVNKYTKNFEIENKEEKEKNNPLNDNDEKKSRKFSYKKENSLNTSNNTKKNKYNFSNKFGDFENIKNDGFPKRTLTTNFSDNKINFTSREIKDTNKNKFNFFSSSDIRNNITLQDSKSKKPDKILVKRALGNDNDNEKISVRKKEEVFNNKNERKKLNNNNPGHSSQPFIRFKVSKN